MKNKNEDKDELNLSAQDKGGDKKKNCRFNGDCRGCEKHGHKAADCWTGPKNADK